MLIFCHWLSNGFCPPEDASHGPKNFVIFVFKYSADEFSLTHFLDDDKKRMDIAPTRQRVIAVDSVGKNWNFLNSKF